MSPQPTNRFEADKREPWSPLSVSLIALLLPAGGAILTIRNLYRLRQLDATTAKRLTMAAYLVFAVGLTALLLSAPRNPNGWPQADGDTSLVLAGGVALATYLVQRMPYRVWRSSHEGVRPSTWLGGAGRAIVYQLIASAVVFPFAITALLLGVGGGAPSHL